MTIIYYFLVSLFRWDMKWITKLGSMWGITRLILVVLACVMIFIDGYIIYDEVTHIQRINTQLERLEPCLQIVSNKPDKRINWGFFRKLDESVWELSKDTDLICSRAKQISIDNALLDVLGISNVSSVKNPMTVKLPNGNTLGSVPKGTTKEQIKEIAIKSGLAKESDFVKPWKIYLNNQNKGRNIFDQFDLPDGYTLDSY